jgi:hypothetical protein
MLRASAHLLNQDTVYKHRNKARSTNADYEKN